jgi:PTS system nitrogen regulatory IIA component
MYLNLIEVAESFGVSERVVEDWVHHEGLPHVPDRGRLVFDRAQVATWAASRGLASRAGFLATEDAAFTSGVGFGGLLRNGGIWRDIPPDDARATLEQILGRAPGLAAPVAALLRQRMRAPGGLNWAPVGGGFALPHLSTRAALGRDSGLIAVVLLKGPLALDSSAGAPDGEPVDRLLFFVAPSPRAHLDILGSLSRLLTRGPLRAVLRRGAADDEILAAFAADAAGGGRTAGEVRP